MSFRDAWMRVGKASKGAVVASTEPLHLVLIEEPEAHLHAQVQQVFIKKAYDVLRAHEDLGDNHRLRTQLVASTHSSHVAHETPFDCLRYFRRQSWLGLFEQARAIYKWNACRLIMPLREAVG